MNKDSREHMNKKGQALVEFIIILPIFLMLLLAAFDLVNIMQTKMKLETILEEVILDESYPLEEKIVLTTEKEDDFVKYKMSLNVDVTSPLVTLVTDNKYLVTVERTIYDK